MKEPREDLSTQNRGRRLPAPAPRDGRWALRTVTLCSGLLAAGCGHSVGDACTTNIDCSPTGDRICDTAQVDGYCTVEGCDLTSCPDEAVCVRFFPANFLSVPCNPVTEGAIGIGVEQTHDCTSSEICLTSGFCAGRTSERRFCMKRCETDGDCRGGYECLRSGSRGAEALPDPSNPGTVPELRFCAQKP